MPDSIQLTNIATLRRTTATEASDEEMARWASDDRTETLQSLTVPEAARLIGALSRKRIRQNPELFQSHEPNR